MKIAILTGGETGEREVSIRSAANIKNLIDFAESEAFVLPEDISAFVERAAEFDLAIPVLHGLGGEDGSLQGLLKHLRIPFVFSDVAPHAIAMDKKFAKEIARGIGVRSPEETTEFPAFAKPRCGGSSVASKLCETKADFDALRNDNPQLAFLVEKPIRGREFSVGVIEYDQKQVPLPVVEIIPKGEFFDYENKYDPEKLATEVCPAAIDAALTDELQRQALAVHSHLGASHVTRSDFIVTAEGEIFFLEINTIPGMTDTSLIPKMTATAGLSFKDILKGWCLEAVR